MGPPFVTAFRRAVVITAGLCLGGVAGTLGSSCVNRCYPEVGYPHEGRYIVVDTQDERFVGSIVTVRYDDMPDDLQFDLVLEAPDGTVAIYRGREWR